MRTLPVLPEDRCDRLCVWVDAGVLNDRRCNRGFACESCPLDAAIRGDPGLVVGGERPGCAAWEFPNDRLYGEGRMWVQRVDSGRVRTGIDACFARFAPPVEEVRPAGRDALTRGEPLALLLFDGGALAAPSPISGRVIAWNEALAGRPELAVAQPYGAGWLAEFKVEGELGALLDAGAARLGARLAARHLARRAAMAVLQSDASWEAWADPAVLEAARRAVGAPAYAALVRGALAGR